MSLQFQNFHCSLRQKTFHDSHKLSRKNSTKVDCDPGDFDQNEEGELSEVYTKGDCQ